MSAALPLLTLCPIGAAVLTAAVPPRAANILAALSAMITVGATAVTAVQVSGQGPVLLAMAGWGAPLGIDLYVDGLSAVLVALTSVVGAAVTAYAIASPKARGHGMFWPLWLALWGGLNAVYVSADLFNTYVALEIVGIGAVALVALGGRDAWPPGLRYLLVAVLGSLAYLLGVALVYGRAGTLDIAQAGERLAGQPVALVALAVMTVGLALKTALFPLHGWLPPAHSSAPPAVSPVLSALVVKASFYLLVRVWFALLGPDAPVAAAQVLGALGALAVLWGAGLALRQTKLKRVVAYSTVAQVGYLFLLFPLATPGIRLPGQDAVVAGWSGALVLALSHGLAKSAMFMTAGTLAMAHGSDRLSDLRGAASRMPMSMLTFALAGVSLAGLPPTLGFLGKWQLLQASLDGGQWWWIPVLLLGGVATAGYTARVVRGTLGVPEEEDLVPLRPVPRATEVIPLVVALMALGLGLRSAELYGLLEVAMPVGADR